VSVAHANMLAMQHDWFADLTGFREVSYDATREQLLVDGDELVSKVNGKRHGIGSLEVPTLAELRSRVEIPTNRRSTVRCVTGEARAMHADPELAGALFQVASQFNLLEMTGPGVTPEDGVTRYSHDHTQGPACAIAAGAATIYRNYFAPVDGESGQTRHRQIDALAPLGAALSATLGCPVSDLWTKRNGYALCTERGLEAVSKLLAECTEEARDDLRGKLAIGLHRDVEVTDVREERRLVSQAFCSALPVAYSSVRPVAWEAFARLVLEASYEATLLAAVEQAHASGVNIVLLTRVGGGAFGNADKWIDDAIVRAVEIVEHAALDIRLVGHGRVHPSSQAIAERLDG
jgi:nucleotide-binding universal stress UspA family protein